MNVLVTGVAGFIGSNLAQALLEEGHRVFGVDNLVFGTFENIPKGVHFIKADVCDSGIDQHFENIDAVFHLAARNCLTDCAENPQDTARVNVMGTANILQACVSKKVSHMIYSDTSAEYEGILEFPSKTNKTRPLSIYACSKKGGALMCDAFSNLHGLKVSTVRYFNVYGPAQDWRRMIPPVMSAFTIRLMQHKRPLIYGSGKKKRDFIHVDDVNAFHLKLLKEENLRGGTYNLGTGKNHSILEVFEEIASLLGSQIEPEFKEELPGEAEETLADISETLATGWEPKVSLREGLQRFIDYVRPRLGKTICPDAPAALNPNPNSNIARSPKADSVIARSPKGDEAI